jgi:hypothetical protein
MVDMTVLTKRRVSALAAGALIAIGVAAPAFAEGSRNSHMTNWIDGDASSNWKDEDTDSTDTHVTFDDCTREFTATIRRTKTLAPDPKVGSEHINCLTYVDAVRAGDLSPANYHFDISDMGISYCTSGVCVFYTTSVDALHIYW